MRADAAESLKLSDADAPDRSARVLLLPPTSRDAEVIAQLFTSSRIECMVTPTMKALCDEISNGAGSLIISEEALLDGVEMLASCLARQPVWSDLPVLVLSKAGAETQRLALAVAKVGNASVIERPVRINTLLSLARSALRARSRQYDVRNHLATLNIVSREREGLLASERIARQEAEQSSRVKDEFLATVSHELRTPLNAIIGWSHIIRSAPGRVEDVTEGINVIERNARAQAQIIEDLLDMSRIINGNLRLDVQPVELASVIQAAADSVGPAVKAKGIRLQLVLDHRASAINGDPNRLQQIFWNLFSNSVKFTPRGGRIQVVLERINSHLEVQVVDTGEGIDPEFLPHVFDRFRQADATTSRRHGGLGLGLAIVKQLIELHGGTVCAKSPGHDQGSTFVVSLPLTAVQPETEPLPQRRHPAAAQTAPPAIDPCVRIEGVRVLIVDDEPDARAVLRRLLEDCKAVVSMAASAEEALSILQSQLPDVLVSDIGMPREDGYSLIRRVRALAPESGGRIPAIALTAYARSEDRIKAVVAGFQHHLSKPVESAELIAMVASCVSGMAKAAVLPGAGFKAIPDPVETSKILLP